MKRAIPSEVENVREWCLLHGRNKDADFIIIVKGLMEENQQITPEQAQRLGKILRVYTLDSDLIEKIKERLGWWRR